jgi:crotonobetainyl-CoA:carnitine CoA-transferase CaiB-like acyl-CoA transferase
LLPGAYCTSTLRDLGARVIKVEDPRGGDPLRHVEPLKHGNGVLFRALNAGKESITLDLRQRGAAPVLARLLDRADVVVESFRPMTARRLCVHAARLRRGRPRLIHCSITAFGQRGPAANNGAHDINILALSGLLDPSLVPGRSPGPPSIPLADMLAGGQGAATAIAAALYSRERTGRGAALDVSMLDECRRLAGIPGAPVVDRLALEGQWTQLLTGASPCYSLYATRDGRHLAVGSIEPKFWRAFLDAIGLRGAERPRFAYERGARRAREEIARLIARRPLAAWERVFARIDACVTPVRAIEEAVAGVQRGAVPRLSRDTARVLRWADVPAAEQRALRRAGVI